MLLVGILGVCWVMHMVVLFCRKRKEGALSSSPDPQADGALNPQASESTDGDNHYALDTIGRDSVYRFFLGETWQGWVVALITLFAQFWMLFVFIIASERRLSDSEKDMVFTFKCPLDTPDCRDTQGWTPSGWLLFAILMVAHVLKDIINGSRMVALCSKGGHPLHKRVRFFFGGSVLIVFSTFILFASTMYNYRIATSNTELIANAVIILFLTDLDEMVDACLVAINPHWAASGNEQSVDAKLDLLKEELNQVKSTVKVLCDIIESTESNTMRYAWSPSLCNVDDASC